MGDLGKKVLNLTNKVEEQVKSISTLLEISKIFRDKIANIEKKLEYVEQQVREFDEVI